MKRLFLFLSVAFAPIFQAFAGLPLPAQGYLHSADQVCLAEVTAIKGDKFTFTTTEILRGKSGSAITIADPLGSKIYRLKSEWLLASSRSQGFWVLPFTVIHRDDQIYLKNESGEQNLDQIKKFLKENPYKQ